MPQVLCSCVTGRNSLCTPQKNSAIPSAKKFMRNTSKSFTQRRWSTVCKVCVRTRQHADMSSPGHPASEPYSCEHPCGMWQLQITIPIRTGGANLHSLRATACCRLCHITCLCVTPGGAACLRLGVLADRATVRLYTDVPINKHPAAAPLVCVIAIHLEIACMRILSSSTTALVPISTKLRPWKHPPRALTSLQSRRVMFRSSSTVPMPHGHSSARKPAEAFAPLCNLRVAAVHCWLSWIVACRKPAVNHQKQAKSTLQQQVATGEGLTCCAPRQLALWHLYSA